MRGEHIRQIPTARDRRGSSPHARGTRTRRRRGVCRKPVHPRMRGEHPGPNRVPLSANGSSPHARGTRRSAALLCNQSRFIPACAGNTACPHRPVGKRPVHPRMRGEHSAGSDDRTAPVGSSPHARGTLSRRRPHTHHTRFIPACAGNTFASARIARKRAVHPRMRGEHSYYDGSTGRGCGSSPHARGTLFEQTPDSTRKFRLSKFYQLLRC